ncbi:MAG: deoxyribodipyrimidine photo-lyase [Fimbriimonadales bacterium]|nr:MAG: deoxyribodipyrimidine photo-lyase [Fimbriimonadales bacterium]
MPPLQVVWFKRDLRAYDHAPLYQASQRGWTLPLYLFEPELWRQPDASNRQWRFVRECLLELDRALGKLAGKAHGLIVRTGDAVAVLEAIHQAHGIDALWAHMEIGNDWTFQRDKAVRRWAQARGVPFHELPQDGVVRGLQSREGWRDHWEAAMRRSLTPAPARLLIPPLHSDALPESVGADNSPHGLRGGRSRGLALLRSFLSNRVRNYARGLSSPLTAPSACSRLSPYLAYGALSLREVVQATRRRIQQAAAESNGAGLLRSLQAFESRLGWRSHFMQRLESLPSIEFEPMHPALARERTEVDPTRFEAWAQGRTGYPFVDACMRMLRATGWINFRMRAMLTAFACYHLWQPWRAVGLHLARLYVDYEPGIHWSQIQMQSGSTGISAFRVYNVVKQSYDQDPTGAFIRRWVPELRRAPTAWIHEPYRMPPEMQRACGCVIGVDYPAPIVEHESAARAAREKLRHAYSSPEAKAMSDQILQRHGSRTRRERQEPTPRLKQPRLFE